MRNGYSSVSNRKGEAIEGGVHVGWISIKRVLIERGMHVSSFSMERVRREGGSCW